MPEKYKHFIENGTTLKRPKRNDLPTHLKINACSSASFSNGIHEFKIKCIRPGAGDAFGITTNTYIHRDTKTWCQNLFPKMSGAMYYYYGGGQISSVESDRTRKINQYDLIKCKTNDI